MEKLNWLWLNFVAPLLITPDPNNQQQLMKNTSVEQESETDPTASNEISNNIMDITDNLDQSFSSIALDVNLQLQNKNTSVKRQSRD